MVVVGGTHRYYTTHHRRLPMHSVKWRRLVRKSSRDVHFFEHHPLSRLNGNEKACMQRRSRYSHLTRIRTRRGTSSPWKWPGRERRLSELEIARVYHFPASRKQSSSIRYFPHSNIYLGVRHKCCIRNLTAKVAHAQLSLVFFFFVQKLFDFVFNV